MSTNTIKFKGAVYAENTSIQVPSGTLYEVKELKSDSLEANSLSITVTSNDTSILKYKKNDKVEYFRDGKRKGIFYLQSVKRVGPNDYSLYGLSTLGRLLQMKHVGGIYTGETVATVVQEICGSVPVIVETVYAKIALYGYLPYADGVTTSARDNLAQVLFAIGAWLGTDENGVLRVEKLWDGTASTIGANRISSQNCNVEYLDPISAVEVVEHGYIPDTKEVTLFDGTAQANDLVVFSEPIHDLSATGFTILESGTNYAILSAGTGTLTGKGYLHSTRVIQRPVSVGVEENVLFVDGATLVSLVNSAAVTDRLAEYYTHREQIRVAIDVDQERAGHVVDLYHPWDKKLVSACLSEREVSISGILEANTKALVGFLPPQPEATEYYDERVILTGSGEWTVPEGVTSLRVVLVEHGADGLDGSSGASGGSVSLIVTSSEAKPGGTWSRQPGAGGAGGAGGEGGLGGHILSADLDVFSGTVFAYSADTETTFGTLSAQNGSRSDAGFTDPVTGDVFGKKGDDGSAGGDGGGGGSANSANFNPGENGTDVPPNTGGAGSEGNYKRFEESETVYKNGYLLVAGGTGGGGAAVGNNGQDAVQPLTSGVRAGAGANAAPPSGTVNYGCGGHGGNGGGGGGGAMGLYLSHGAYLYDDTPSGTWLDLAGGTGGSGSTGGPGGDGCIIIYYRKLKPLSAGWLRDNTPKPLLDRLGRRLIV